MPLIAGINTGSIADLCNAIEAGYVVVLEFDSESERSRCLNSVKNHIYRQRGRLSAIMDCTFDVFNHSMETLDDGTLLLTMQTRERVVRQYNWSVLD